MKKKTSRTSTTKKEGGHCCTLLMYMPHFNQDIHDLLESWSEYLKETSAIFLRAPSYNKTMFFGGRNAPLDKKDQRVRVLPFATRRATFSEVQRVFDLLSTLHVYRTLRFTTV